MYATEFLNTHIIFRFDEFKQFMESRAQGVTDRNCYMTLYNYCKNNKLLHVRKELYVALSDKRYQPIGINPFLIAGKATDDAILAYHTALESHGIAYTTFNEHTYLTTHRTNEFTFQQQHYRSIYQPLQNKINEGIETITLVGINIQRTNLERTIVDVLDRPDVSGGWEEVIRSLEQVTVFNASQVVDYALSLGRASIAAKVGYFFDQRRDYLRVDPQIVDRLLPHIPKQPYYVDRKSALGQGTYIKKWKIIMPNYLHNRQWEESGYDTDN